MKTFHSKLLHSDISDAAAGRLWFLQLSIVLGWFATFALHPEWLRLIGISHYGIWFLDTLAILASNDALAMGLDVFRPNPLDYFGRPHVYSHWWFVLGQAGLTRADVFWCGVLLATAFVAAAFLRLRPRTAGELAWNILVLCAPPVLLALERANNDLVVFVLLAPVVPLLALKNRMGDGVAVLLLAVATGLKFYPAVAGLVFLAGTDTREVRWRAVAVFCVLGLVGGNLASDFAHLKDLIPQATGLMSFSSETAFISVGLSSGAAKMTACLLGVLIVLLALRLGITRNWQIAPADQSSWLSFVLGAALLTGCFFAGRNYAYRWIFAIWLAPLLWRLIRDKHAPAGVRRLARITTGLFLFVLWVDSLASGFLLAHLDDASKTAWVNQWANYIAYGTQPIQWAFFTCLLIFLTHFTTSAMRVIHGSAAVVPQSPAC